MLRIWTCIVFLLVILLTGIMIKQCFMACQHLIAKKFMHTFYAKLWVAQPTTNCCNQPQFKRNGKPIFYDNRVIQKTVLARVREAGKWRPRLTYWNDRLNLERGWFGWLIKNWSKKEGIQIYISNVSDNRPKLPRSTMLLHKTHIVALVQQSLRLLRNANVHATVVA